MELPPPSLSIHHPMRTTASPPGTAQETRKVFSYSKQTWKVSYRWRGTLDPNLGISDPKIPFVFVVPFFKKKCTGISKLGRKSRLWSQGGSCGTPWVDFDHRTGPPMTQEPSRSCRGDSSSQRGSGSPQCKFCVENFISHLLIEISE